MRPIIGQSEYRVALLLTLSKVLTGGHLTESHRVEVESFMACCLIDDDARRTFEVVAVGDMQDLLMAVSKSDLAALNKAARDGYDLELLNEECGKIRKELIPALVN